MPIDSRAVAEAPGGGQKDPCHAYRQWLGGWGAVLRRRVRRRPEGAVPRLRKPWGAGMTDEMGFEGAYLDEYRSE